MQVQEKFSLYIILPKLDNKKIDVTMTSKREGLGRITADRSGSGQLIKRN